MSFTSATRFILRLDGDLVESVTSNTVFVGGDGTPEFNGGYVMQRGQYLYMTDFLIGISTAFTVGFRFTPVNEGEAEDPVNGDLVPMKKPVIEIGTGVLSGEDYNVSVSRVKIYEETLPDNKNRLVAVLTGNTTGTAVSNEYDAGKEHYVALVWNAGALAFYIDGKDELDSSSSIPTSIAATISGVWINNQSLGSAYNVLLNNALISDVFIQNDGLSELQHQKVINSGLEFVVDSEETNYDEFEFPIVFNDPSAIKVTDVYDDGTYLYAARSDGKLLRGSPLLWESRREYLDSREAEILKKFGDGVVVDDGFLKITEGMVKL